jgi:hypothetical protein
MKDEAHTTIAPSLESVRQGVISTIADDRSPPMGE